MIDWARVAGLGVAALGNRVDPNRIGGTKR
jgi:hypothetical protein